MKFMKGEKLRMGIIRNQDFGILALKISALQRTWDLVGRWGETRQGKDIRNLCSCNDRFLQGSKGRFFS